MSAQASATGIWSGVLPWPVEAVHTHLLPTGKVMFYGFSDDARLWDPATGGFTAIAPAGFNIFCTGHSFLPDGRLFLAGGHVSNSVGLPNAAIYDPFTNTWSHQPNMNAGRWYPTNTTLPNGDVLVVSGDIDTTQVNPLPQIWQRATGTWRDLTSAQLALPLYPFMFLMSDGRVFQAGPNQNARYLDTSGTGTWTPAATSRHGLRDYGSAVMYDEGKVLIVGGGDPPTNTAEVIDLNAATPAWRTVAPMAHRRRHLNATLLPDGKVLITGGSSGAGFDNAANPVFPSELWDPATETFTPLPAITQYRGYHAIALLLPDGRVLSTSGDRSADTAEIYSPAYLFKGPRPVVAAAPQAVHFGQKFTVTTPDAGRIGAVNLIRIGSVTHAFNMDQRINRLAFVANGTELTVTAPAGPTFAPPGYYMVFLIDTNGVPSVAPFVRLDSAAAAATTVTVRAPGDGARLSGETVFQGLVQGLPLNTYSMFWQVDGDSLTPMADSWDGLHKDGYVDVSSWNWRGAGPYALNFVARGLDGRILGETPVTIFVGAGSAPAAPTLLTATTASPTQIQLAWTDNATDETSYLVERCAAGCATFAHIATLAANVRSYSNTALTAGTTYTYRVRAANAHGHSAYSNTAAATTPTPPPVPPPPVPPPPVPPPPAAPTNLAVWRGARGVLHLGWTDASTNESGFKIERCTGWNCQWLSQVAQVGANRTTFANSGLKRGTLYRYRVRAFNANGHSAYTATAQATAP